LKALSIRLDFGKAPAPAKNPSALPSPRKKTPCRGPARHSIPQNYARVMGVLPASLYRIKNIDQSLDDFCHNVKDKFINKVCERRHAWH